MVGVEIVGAGIQCVNERKLPHNLSIMSVEQLFGLLSSIMALNILLQQSDSQV